MGRWRYTLKFGEALRNAIEDENYEDIISGLVACFTELHKALPDEYDEDDLQGDLADISGIYETFEDGDDDIEDELNWKLDELYDLCDALQVWVGGI